MLSKNPLFTALSHHYQQISSLHLTQLFAEDPLRFERFSLEAAGLMMDYSKNRLVSQTLELLIAYAQSRDLPAQIAALFSGQLVNNTEKRPALHTALRDPSNKPLYVGGTDITAAVQHSLEIMGNWVEQLLNGHWLGFSQKPITAIVHIGIGGSHLGPLLAIEALAPYHQSLPCHLIASVDSAELAAVLAKLNPHTTLFILGSKTFSTQEVLVLADQAKAWLQQAAGSQSISQHFLATTANVQNALDYGIAAERILPFWEWVGGRFSVWSAIGLPVALKIGMSAFKQLLAGAHSMDNHFRTAPLNSNMPVILGLIGFWYIQFFQAHAQAVLPYDYRLRSLPRYLQQLDMESNGKQVQKNGQPVAGLTAPVLFGEMGTNGQHSFHQLLFQGTHLIPVDFITVLDSPASKEDRSILQSHCLAQSRGLMTGKPAEQIKQQLLERGYSAQQAEELAAHKAVFGNQPSNTCIISELTPQTLGSLMALYEHKIYVQGVLWNINSFDQWGVELGKEIAQELLSSLLDKSVDSPAYDASTVGLLNYIRFSKDR